MKPCIKIGEKYGQLLVLKQVESTIKRRARFECLCDCGIICIKKSHLLKSKHTKSCGCYRKRVTKYRKFKGLYEIPGEYFSKISAGAKARNLEFNITIEYIWNLFLKQNRKCAISGIDIKFQENSKDKNKNASLDRIDSSKGYIEGNVQWVHKLVNIMKQSMIDKEFINWCKIIAIYNK